jgi:hypothetical protein
MVSHPRMVADVCAEAGWSPRRRSSWTKRRGMIEPSSAQAVGTSAASMRPAVSSGNQNSPPQSAASSAASDRALIEDGIALMRGRGRRLQGRSRCTLGAVIWHFALSSAPRDELETFVGASPRRGTGVWRDTLYVAGEDGCLYALSTSVAAMSVNMMAHASTRRLS